MNKTLLYTLYAIHSMSGNEKKMRKYLKKVAKDCGATEIVQDAAGNLLITKGKSETYPCMAAHMDQVQQFHSKDFQIVEVMGDVMGYSPKNHKQQGLGADDKNGIYICLEMLRKYDAIKVAFFVGEECGCIGSSRVDLQFFSDCRYIIEPDRKGKSDLITSMYCGDVCSKEFIDAIGYKEFGYKIDHGSITDVGTLTERGVGISCLNLSCGYYDAHTDHEICVIAELENCMNFVSHIIDTLTDVYPFDGAGYDDYGFGSYGRHGGFGRCSRFGGFRDEWDEYYSDGYYDEDYDIMSNYLNQNPSLSFEIIKDCMSDFHASYVFRKKDDAEVELSEMYHDIQDTLRKYNHDKDADADDLAGELSA